MDLANAHFSLKVTAYKRDVRTTEDVMFMTASLQGIQLRQCDATQHELNAGFRLFQVPN
jgi:hypothetical protein